MKFVLLFTLFMVFSSATVFSDDENNNSGFDHTWPNQKHQTFMRPYKHNQYGYGTHEDATGRPFQWETRDGQTSFGRVKEDGYGLGLGMDEYGRPVKPKAFGE